MEIKDMINKIKILPHKTVFAIIGLILVLIGNLISLSFLANRIREES